MQIKETLKDVIRNRTCLLEVIGENIDLHAEIYANSFYNGKHRTKKEVIKIVIDNLNNELEKYD
jgi:hypothetical protein